MPPKPSKSEYLLTDTGNKVSRRNQIHGSQNIILGGRTVIQAEVCIRGDLIRTTIPSNSSSSSSSSTSTSSKPSTSSAPAAQNNVAVSIGRYTFLSAGSILHPPSKTHRGIFSYYPLKIGDNVYIGRGSVIEAAVIGSNVWIGEGCVVGNMAILRDGVKVLDGTVVSAGMVIPSGVVVGGRPGRIVGELGMGWEGVDGRTLWKNVG
ncbi:MAG: hypothetical protein MMC33_001411 [Icmadophila ericetorum]|nr:hypothetical protein [Icmadophila ericetorum]